MPVGLYHDLAPSLGCATPTKPHQQKLKLFQGYNLSWLLRGPLWQGELTQHILKI